MGSMIFPDELEKYGKLMNKNFQAQPIYSFESRQNRNRNRNSWGRINEFIADIGTWVDKNRKAFANNISVIFYFLVWIGLAIGVIILWISSSFWSALLTAIIGGVVVYYAAAIGMFMLMFTLQIFFFVIRYVFYNIYTLLLTLAIVLFITFSNPINIIKDRTIDLNSVLYEPNYYCNVSTVLNVREQPNSKARVIGQLKGNQDVYVYSIENNFAKIDFKGNIAYVKADYLNKKTGSSNPNEEPNNNDNLIIKELIGQKMAGYKAQRALQDRLGFWCGNQLGYGEGKFFIERWENTKTQDLWLVLIEKSNNDEVVIRDVLPFEQKTVGDIGTFSVYNKQTEQWSDYMMIQVSNNNELVKIYDVNYQRGKIIARDPEPYWGKVQTERDPY